MTLLSRARVSLGELARLAGEDVDSLRRALRHRGVPLHKYGSKLWVHPDELAMFAPELYRALSRAQTVANPTRAKTGS